MHDYTPMCEACDTLPATQDLHFVDLPGSADERGNSIPVCDSHVCWQTARDEIDEFGGIFQQTVYLQAPTVGMHRRDHDVPERAVTQLFSLTAGAVTAFWTCADCKAEWSPTACGLPRCTVNHETVAARTAALAVA